MLARRASLVSRLVLAIPRTFPYHSGGAFLAAWRLFFQDSQPPGELLMALPAFSGGIAPPAPRWSSGFSRFARPRGKAERQRSVFQPCYRNVWEVLYVACTKSVRRIPTTSPSSETPLHTGPHVGLSRGPDGRRGASPGRGRCPQARSRESLGFCRRKQHRVRGQQNPAVGPADEHSSPGAQLAGQARGPWRHQQGIGQEVGRSQCSCCRRKKAPPFP